MKRVALVLVLFLLYTGFVVADGTVRVELNKTEITLALKKTALLKASVFDGNQQVKTPKGSWESSDETIATVTKTGTITAKATGTAVIRYTYESSEGEAAFAECSVTAFVPIASISVVEKKYTLNVGEECTVTPTFKPEDATFKTLEWSSSDESVAIVEDGIIRAIGPGTSRIKLATIDGSKRNASLDVIVPSLNVKEKDIVIETIGEVTLPIDYYGIDPENNVTITATGKSVNYEVEYQKNKILLKLNACSTGKTKLVITDKGCKINGKNVSETLNIEAKDEAVPDIFWLQYTSVKWSGSRLTYQIKNCSNYEVVELHNVCQYLNQFGEQVFNPTDNGITCYNGCYSNNIHIEPGKTKKSNHVPRNLGKYSGITEVLVAVGWFRTADGVYHYIPSNRLYWFSSEEGYLEIPKNLSRCVDISSDIRDLSNQVSLGFDDSMVFDHTREFYRVKHTGLFVSNVLAKSIADNCGLTDGDVIYAFDGIPWEDDPHGLDKSRAKLAKGEETVFTIERSGKLMDVTIKVE